MTWRPWRTAMRDALYGPDGFYRTGPGPAAHFRTSVHTSPLFAGALRELARQVDAGLGHPPVFDVADVGAGRGELAAALAVGAPTRWRVHAVDVVPRPAGLPAAVRWYLDPGALPPLTGLVVANEWLDTVPVDVVAGGRTVLVDGRGAERPGPPATAADLAWLAAWWPGAVRAEVGRERDAAWAGVLRRLRRGVAVAVDYAVDPARHRHGTLTGYREGRQVAPVPDGGCDLTAHVLLEACAAAGTRAGAAATALCTQRAALHALGVAGRPPAAGLAPADPVGYATALRAAAEAAELTAAAGLGAFRWLGQAVDGPLPPALLAAAGAGVDPRRDARGGHGI